MENTNDFQVKSKKKKKLLFLGVSEWITYREMEFAVALEFRVQQWPMFLPTGGIMSLHAHVDTHKEILEIQSDAGAIGRRNLLIELVELEHSSRLVLIVLNGPYVACVEEQAQFNHPKQLGTVLKVDVKADVAALVDEVGQAVVAVVTARAQGAHTPTAHTVGTATVEAFLER